MVPFNLHKESFARVEGLAGRDGCIRGDSFTSSLHVLDDGCLFVNYQLSSLAGLVSGPLKPCSTLISLIVYDSVAFDLNIVSLIKMSSYMG